MKYFASIVLALTACNGSDLDPGSGDDPGGGTQTLVVEGSVTAEAALVNARTNADFNTDFSVRLELNGVPVTTGTVSVTSASGTVELLFQPDGDRAGRWVGAGVGYDEVYVLDVVSGPDTIDGVRVDGPSIHVFTAPTAGATVDSTMPLEVTWASNDEADSAAIDAEQLDRLAIPDSGDYILAAGALKAEQDKAVENRIELTRSNRIVPAGAAGGSQWAVQVRNRIDVVAQPTL